MFILCRIPDEEAGEIPAACVVLKQDTFISSKEIKEFVASKVLCISILDPQALHEVPSKLMTFNLPIMHAAQTNVNLSSTITEHVLVACSNR